MSGPRLSNLGVDPESTLTLVRFFDELDQSAANADAVVRAAALLAECTAGSRWASGVIVRFDSAGRADAEDCIPPAPPGPDDEPAVWLERSGPGHPLDPVLLDRLRHSLRAVTARTGVTPRIGDPALVEAVLSGKERLEDRARAIRLLGLDETRELRVLAVSAQSPPDALPVITRELQGLSVRWAAMGSATAVVCQGARDIRTISDRLDAAIAKEFPAPLTAGSDRGPWVGIGASGSVFAAPASWEQALRALRFASSTGFGRRAVAYERLSSLEILTELPLDLALRNPALAQINEIAATPAGAVQVDTVEAFCVFGSLRRTAEELHVHHSTVAARLARVESALGWDLDDPMDRFSATLVLMVRRIALSSAELGDPDGRRMSWPNRPTDGG